MNFENKILEAWLDDQTQLVMKKVTSGEGLESADMMVLVLKIQTNHVAHMEQDLRQEMVDLRQEMNRRLDQVDKRLDQVDKHLDQVDKRLDQVDKHLVQVDKRLDQVDKRLDQVDKNFEQVDKRFEQVDKRFEQVDKRFEQVDKNMNAMMGRIDNFMKWSFGTTIAVGALVVAVLQYLG